MKVALVHNLPPGGARRVMAEHAARLPAEVVEFCPATATPVTARATIVALAPRARSVPRWRRPSLRYGDRRATVGAWLEIARLVSAAAPDVVLAHPCQYATAPPALRWLGAPSVYFCHEPRRVDYEPEVTRTRRGLTSVPYAPLYRAQRRSDRAAVLSASALVTNSEFTAGRIMEVYARTATPIPLGVPDHFAALARPAEPRHILSVGALTAAKGHELVIDAAAIGRRRWPVVIVTPRPAAAPASLLRRRAAQRDVALEIRAAVSDAELVGLYQRALATVYLARAEPFGLVSIEAQACGSPVIVADEGGLPETVLDGLTGWRVRRRSDAAAARLDLLADPAVRGPMTRRAAEHGTSFSWERSTRALSDALQRAGAQARAAAP